jgi:hypothetical protein
MLLKKCHEFVLKGNLSVMFLLTGNVLFNLWQTGMAHAERAITDLPCECFLALKTLVNPTRGIRLQFAHQIGQRMLRGQRCQNVNMIGRTVDNERCPVVCADDAAEIRKQSRLQIRVQQWATFFCAENDVRQQMGEGVRHKIIAAEQRTTIAHGETAGMQQRNCSSSGRSDRKQALGDLFSFAPAGAWKFFGRFGP